jgi:hypothetical protein
VDVRTEEGRGLVKWVARNRFGFEIKFSDEDETQKSKNETQKDKDKDETHKDKNKDESQKDKDKGTEK